MENKTSKEMCKQIRKENERTTLDCGPRTFRNNKKENMPITYDDIRNVRLFIYCTCERVRQLETLKTSYCIDTFCLILIFQMPRLCENL